MALSVVKYGQQEAIANVSLAKYFEVEITITERPEWDCELEDQENERLLYLKISIQEFLNSLAM